MPASLEQQLKPLSLSEQDYILKAIVDGKKVRDICLNLGITGYGFYQYLERYPDFNKNVELARVYQSHLFVDELMHATEGALTIAEVQAARVWSDNAKWVASKMVPTKYADNINVNVNHHLDLSSILLAAEDRVLPLLAKKMTSTNDPQSTIDVQYIVEPIVNSAESISLGVDIPEELKDMI